MDLVDETTLETCQGTIERVTFHNPENGFCVLRLNAKGHRDVVTVIANASSIHAGEYIEVKGAWVNDHKHGQQFKAVTLQTIQPTTLEGIEKYLGSGLIKGIGPAFAKVLIEGFGDEIFDVIENHPKKLLKLSGIGQKRLDEITESWVEQKAVREIMVFLQSYGIGTARAVRIYKTYKNDAIRRITENPYCLAQDIRGIGFKIADQLAQRMGMDPDSPRRAEAGVLHVMQEFVARGHCATSIEELVEKSVKLLEMNESTIREAIDEQVANEFLISDEINGSSSVYISSLYIAEQGVVAQMTRLLSSDQPTWADMNPAEALYWVQKKTSIQLSTSQIAAVELALKEKVMCITGGPGVGKTTIVNSIIKIIRNQGAHVALCAPTGRAAKRLSESTGLKAKTIHRLLEYDAAKQGFLHDREAPLDIDYLVVDEASMVDVSLMHSLLSAIPDHAALLIVGDVDQLPSVGPGKVLADCIDSGVIPTARLTEIFRQSEDSHIIKNAHRINHGESPRIPESNETSDFYVVAVDDPNTIYQKLEYIVAKRLPERFGFNPMTDIQVLSPMNRSGLGVKSLNIELQKALNPQPKTSITKFGRTFSLRDKVIQTVNNYDKEIFNGDIGFIESIDLGQSVVTLRVDDRLIMYDASELDELNLAYAISIHKSQGSEFPVVVIPLAMQHYMLLQRNLLYTGVTRGKQMVVLIGQQKAIDMAVANVTQNQRVTKLAERLSLID